MYTCEDSSLAMLAGLEIAVANQETQMLELLWPISLPSPGSKALWMAARLDHLAFVQHLVHANLPMVRERPAGVTEGLLRPASLGVTLNTGR